MLKISTTYKSDFRPGDLLKQIAYNIAEASALVQSKIRKEKFSDKTTHSTLKNRTGHLNRSVRAMLPPKIEGGKVHGGIFFGTRYAATHIGPKGGFKTIVPKKKQWLAIPISNNEESKKALFTPAGVLRGGPLSGLFEDTFFAKSKKGNLILFGKKIGSKTMKTSQGGKIKVMQGVGNIIPLFVMKKQVKVPFRIHPKEIFVWFMQQFKKSCKENGVVSGNAS